MLAAGGSVVLVAGTNDYDLSGETDPAEIEVVRRDCRLPRGHAGQSSPVDVISTDRHTVKPWSKEDPCRLQFAGTPKIAAFCLCWAAE